MIREIHELTFSWYDYLLFAVILCVSIGIGLYFGCTGKKQSTNEEYLLGGRNMKVIPVAISMTVGHISGITFLGSAGEIYSYGTQYWMCMFQGIIVGLVMIFVYLPVFFKLNVSSSFEYLELRFDRRIRKLASFIYIVATLLYIPIVVYIPALAFNQVSGIELQYIIPVICLVCIVYTTLGGLKGVVWADTLQSIITLSALFALFGIGIRASGGLTDIWHTAQEGDRIEFFNINPDPTARNTFWTAVVGLGINGLALFGINPSSVQRLMSVSSLQKANRILVIFGIGIFLMLNICCFFGLLTYARYANCDPYTLGAIKSMDQILPYYVMDIAKDIPGLPGLFVSGVCTTALSTMSTHLNTVGGSIYSDFIKNVLPSNFSEKKGNIITKCLVVITGVLCIGIVYIMKNLGGVVQINAAFSGITSGPFLALFTLGMLCPASASKGAFYGTSLALMTMTWIVIGNQLSISSGSLYYPFRPLNTSGCLNESDILSHEVRNMFHYNEEAFTLKEPMWLYRVSYYWYTSIGTVTALILSLLFSLVLKEKNHRRHETDLYSPIIPRILKRCS